MAGRIRDEDIALVRERLSIDAVIGEYVQLRNAGGGSLKGLCPFHDEKSPSFNVTPSRGFYYCFGCGEGGDVLTFVQKIDSLSFAEAVERLAAQAGIELRYEQGGYVPGREQSKRSRLVEAHKAAQQFYAERLSGPGAEAGRRFLADRGFERADAEHFGVGYSPNAWEELVGHLRRQGFSTEEMVLAGLAREGRRGPIDRFRGRLMWPIRDMSGDIVGFGARKLDPDDDGPKYLNTPETPIFKKGTVLYGADLAKREIAKRRQAVVVEGYTDVMACHLAGVSTAVATCGTSLGDDHIKILRRLLMDQNEFQGEVIFTFDGDGAGQKAALRAFEFEHKFATQTFVSVQPDGLDPCDLRLKRGDAAVRDLVAARLPLFEFAIRSKLESFNLDTEEGRLGALDAAAPLVAHIKDTGLRQRYAVNLDRWLGLLDERFVLRRVSEHARGRRGGGQGSGHGGKAPEPRRGAAPAQGTAGGAASGPAPGAERPYDPRDPAIRVERETLKIAVQFPALAGAAFDELADEAFTVPLHAAVRRAVEGAGGAQAAEAEGGNGAGWVTRVREAAETEEIRAFVIQLAVETLHNSGEPDIRYAAANLDRIKDLATTRRIANLKSRLQRINPVDQQAEYNRLFGELIALEQESRRLREGLSGAV